MLTPEYMFSTGLEESYGEMILKLNQKCKNVRVCRLMARLVPQNCSVYWDKQSQSEQQRRGKCPFITQPYKLPPLLEICIF